MRYLGIDYGTKRIGIALSDEDGGFAFAHSTLKNDAKFIIKINEIIKTEQVSEIVVGKSVTLSGRENILMGEIGEFIATLEENFDMPIHLQSEAFSSVEASRFAPKGRERDDSASAAIILQRFLDMHRGQKNMPSE
jgi:putative holliday junction resolvase